jgi:hypothetical protein
MKMGNGRPTDNIAAQDFRPTLRTLSEIGKSYSELAEMANVDNLHKDSSHSLQWQLICSSGQMQ